MNIHKDNRYVLTLDDNDQTWSIVYIYIYIIYIVNYNTKAAIGSQYNIQEFWI